MTELYTVQAEGRTITFEQDEIQTYKRKLLAKRHELLETLEQVRAVAQRQSAEADETGDLSSVPFHQADIGTEHFEQEINLQHLEREQQLIADIDNALEKIQSRRFGLCEVDHKPIAKERLEALPWTRYCIDCQRAIEEGR